MCKNAYLRRTTYTHLTDRAVPLFVSLWSPGEARALDVEHPRALVAAEHITSVMAHPAVGVVLSGILEVTTAQQHM